MPAADQLRTLRDVTRDVGVSLAALRRNTVKHRPRPPQAGWVLDVGSGQAPNPRSDLIVDKYVADDFERGAALVIDKPLVVADGHALPFAERTFAYVIASHVLEHATDPVRFAGELQRVGTAGFVQVPSRQSELTFGWAFHPWLIDREGDVLVFRPRAGLEAPIGEVFHHAVTHSPLFALWFGANRDAWHYTLHWTGSFAVRVEGTSQAPQTAPRAVARTLAGRGGRAARGPVGDLRSALRCPHDRGELAERSGRLVCGTCDRSYPVAGSVPVLLDEAAS